MRSPTFQWSTMKGPLPMGWPQSALASQSGSGTKPSCDADWWGSVTHGLAERTTRVRSSLIWAPVRSLMAHADEYTGEFMYDNCVRAMSWAVTGWPLWNFIPARRTMVHSV